MQYFSVQDVTADKSALTLTLMVVDENMSQLDKCVLKLRSVEVSK